MLSKAFVNAVCDFILQENQRKLRNRNLAEISVNNDDTNIVEILNRNNKTDNDLKNLNESMKLDKKNLTLSPFFNNYSDNEKDDFQNNTPIVERISSSPISSQSFNKIDLTNKSILSLNQETKLQKIDENNLKKQQCFTSTINSNLNNNNLNDFSSNNSEICNINGNLCKNTSCLPINFNLSNNLILTQNEYKNDLPLSSTNNFNKLIITCKPTAIDSPVFLSLFLPIPSSNSHSNSLNLFHSNKNFKSENSNLKNKKILSNFFLNYNQPKIGEPGRPGTNDLNQSIRRLNIIKQVLFYFFAKLIVFF